MRNSCKLTHILMALAALIVMSTAALAADPGTPFPSSWGVSDQKAGSLLVYNIYTSSAAAPNTTNTRIAITNTNPTAVANVHIFFVDGSNCTIADSYVCLTPNQTAAFLASDFDPNTTGYIYAIATNDRGCPVGFNWLIGDLYVKFATGHAANLAAESFSSLSTLLPLQGPFTLPPAPLNTNGGVPVLGGCDANSITVQLFFDDGLPTFTNVVIGGATTGIIATTPTLNGLVAGAGGQYNRAPRVLAVDNIPSRGDGNDTRIIIDRVGGSLATGQASLANLFGILYDDVENPLSFTFNATQCQFISSLSNSFPRTAPRFEQFIPPGRSGWAKFYALTEGVGIVGSVINFNPNAATAQNAFNGGHNMHKLTLTHTSSVTIPIFPSNCGF